MLKDDIKRNRTSNQVGNGSNSSPGESSSSRHGQPLPACLGLLVRLVNDSPAFQFYPHDWISDWSVELMTNEQLGAYFRLCCHAWHSEQPGRLPNDRSTLAGLCRMSVEWWDANGPSIVRAFKVEKDGWLTHPYLIKQWEKQQTYKAQKVEAGKASAAKRQQALNERSTDVQRTGNSSSSTSPSGIIERERVVPPMSRQEYDQEFSTRHWTPDFLNHYWNELDACDWQPKNYDRPLARKGVGSWLANRWPDWQAKDHERKHGKHQANPPSGDRNAGTYNEGRTAATGLTTAEIAAISQRKNREMVAQQELERLQRSSPDQNAAGGNGVPASH